MDLKTIRKAKKVTIEKIGLNSRTVKAIEEGQETMSVKALKQYLNAIGLNIGYFLT